MKNITPLLLITVSLVISASAQTARVCAIDLKPLDGKQWVGELTYLD